MYLVLLGQYSIVINAQIVMNHVCVVLTGLSLLTDNTNYSVFTMFMGLGFYFSQGITVVRLFAITYPTLVMNCLLKGDGDTDVRTVYSKCDSYVFNDKNMRNALIFTNIGILGTQFIQLMYTPISHKGLLFLRSLFCLLAFDVLKNSMVNPSASSTKSLFAKGFANYGLYLGSFFEDALSKSMTSCVLLTLPVAYTLLGVRARFHRGAI